MRFQVLIILALMIAVAIAADQYSPVVTTKSGKVKGLLASPTSDLSAYQFTAIPYAQPPLGSLRFRKPTPVKPWNNTLTATKVPNSCIQRTTFPPGDAMGYMAQKDKPAGPVSEDCLFLNLWVPKSALDSSTVTPSLGVMVFIHGGGFYSGSISTKLLNGAVLAAKGNIIVATIQYRLGSLGFAYLGNDTVPGNAGLWDQLEALKWIYDNIGVFGGSNSAITLAGQSTGAASVAFHLVSPRSRKYFQRAILQSGSALAPFVMNSAPTVATTTTLLFKNIVTNICNKTFPDPLSETIKCMSTVNASVFPQSEQLPGYGLPFLPIIDGDFIPRDPQALLQGGNYSSVPLLVGTNKDEGSMYLILSPRASAILPTFAMPNKALDKLNITHYGQLLEISFGMFAGQSSFYDPIVVKALQLHYWPRYHEGFPAGAEIATAASNSTGDYSITCPTYTFSQLASARSAVFNYYFTHRRPGHWAPEWMGVMHTDELPYVFGQPYTSNANSLGFTSDDQALSDVFIKYWSNFVKTGNPNGNGDSDLHTDSSDQALPTWPPYKGGSCPYQFFEINPRIQVSNDGEDGIICGLKARDCLFWDDYFARLTRVMYRAGPVAGGQQPAASG